MHFNGEQKNSLGLRINDSTVVQVVTPIFELLINAIFFQLHRTSWINLQIHGFMEASRGELKGKAYEQWHHWILEFQVPTTSSKCCKKSHRVGPFTIFNPPSSNDTNPWPYSTKLLITKLSKSFASECYNEPLRRVGKHSRKLVSLNSEEKRSLWEKEATMSNERDRFGKGLRLHLWWNWLLVG